MPVDTDSNLWTESEMRSDVRQKVVNFMQKNVGTAYTAEEVCENVLTTDGESPYCDTVGCVTVVVLMLEDLCSENLVERRFVDSSVHYAYEEDLYYV